MDTMQVERGQYFEASLYIAVGVAMHILGLQNDVSRAILYHKSKNIHVTNFDAINFHVLCEQATKFF